MKVVRFLREILRDAFPGAIERITAAGTIGALALDLAGLKPPDTQHFIMAWWGAGGAVYALIVWGRAPDDPDLPPV